MVLKDRGVVLKASRSGETSRQIVFLGRESGKIRLIAKGALTAKSPFAGVLEPGGVLAVIYYHKEGRSVYFLKDVDPITGIESRRRSLFELAPTLASLEILDQVCYWGSPEPGIVGLAETYLSTKRPADPLALFLAFEYMLLAVLGVLPDLGRCIICEKRLSRGFFHPEAGVSACARHSGASGRRIRLDAAVLGVLERIDSEGLDGVCRRGFDRDSRKRLGRILHWTYTFHVQGYRLPESLKLIPKDDR